MRSKNFRHLLLLIKQHEFFRKILRVAKSIRDITVLEEIPFMVFAFQKYVLIKNVGKNINWLQFYLKFMQNHNYILDCFSTESIESLARPSEICD